MYTRTREWLRGGGPAAATAGQELDAVRARVRELLPQDEPALGALVDRLDDRMIAALTPRQIARHLALAGRWARGRAGDGGGPTVELAVTAYPLKGHTELAVVAEDRHGLLGHIAGVLAAHRVSIDSAIVSTVEQEGGAALALDLFTVRDPYGKVIAAEDGRWEPVRRDLAAVIEASGEGRGEPTAAVADLIRRRRRGSSLRPRVTPEVPTVIQVVDDASDRFTVIEVATRDRGGVLHTITGTMAELGLDIHLAKVSTEGEKAADAFYVTDRHAGGGKLTDPDRVRQLDQALRRALAAADE